MNTRNKLLTLAAICMIASSCSKDDDPAPDNSGGGAPANTSASTTPNFPNSDGSLWAINTVTLQTLPVIGTIEVELGTGVAVFSDDNYTSFQNAGTVELNGAALTKNQNNSYVFTPSQTNPNGLDFQSGQCDWDISGSAMVSAFNQSVNSIQFPDVDTISSSSNVDLSSDYTITTNSVVGADSVIFTLGSVLKTLPGNASSCTFTSAEMSTISAGQGIAQIAAYKITNSNVGGANYYFGKETVQTRSVNFQ